MIGISNPTAAIMLKCGMLDDLVNTQAQKYRNANLGVTEQAIQERVQEDKLKLESQLQRLNQWHVEDVVETYKNNYKQIATDLVNLEGGPLKADHKLKELSHKVHDLITNKKNEESKMGAFSRFLERLSHLCVLKGFNTEAEYAEKVYNKLTNELNQKSQQVAKDALKNWPGDRITEDVKLAVANLSLREIELGAKGELFKLKKRSDSWGIGREAIMGLFNTDDQKKAFLRGVAQRNDCLLQVDELIRENFSLERNDFLKFVDLSRNTGIEEKVIEQFMIIYQKLISNRALTLTQEENKILQSINKPIWPLSVGTNWIDNKDGLERIAPPSYLKQYIAELTIRGSNFLGLAAMLRREGLIIRSENDPHLRDVMKNLYQGAVEPLLLTEDQLRRFRAGLTLAAFG